MKNLIIVESPTKAKTISNFLYPAKDFKVIATKGHIRDLPEKRFGIKVEGDSFTPLYTVSPENKKKLDEIIEFAKQAEKIYLATDEDREGEAIGFHTAVALKLDPKRVSRISFHEITRDAVIKAFNNPRYIDMNLVNAQQTRRLLDRIVGYKLSPLLGQKIQRGLSAGRVQSASLKIIIDREREIKNFIPVEYWKMNTIFEEKLEANLYEFKSNKLDKISINTLEYATEIEESLLKDKFIIGEVDLRERKVSPSPPFMTSTLQQVASTKFGFSPKKTMNLAQMLYEGVEFPDGKKSGLITYMRTDSLNLSEDATSRAIELIQRDYGKDYVKDGIRKYISKSKGAQEAHEAIRPTIVDLTPLTAKTFLEPDLYKLYNLIYNRFFASQTADANFHNQTIDIVGNESLLKLNGRKLLFKGFYAYADMDEEVSTILSLKVGDEVNLTHLSKEQRFTEPPNRYSEAGLIKKLESLGIGRPSTYSSIISTLTTREYIAIDRKKKNMTPTEVAFIVIETLEKHFPEIVDETFTAHMEDNLDLIANNERNWQNILKDFYFPFIEKIKTGKIEIKSLKETIPVGRECPQCNSPLVKRKGRFGEFIACSGFPKCRFIEKIDGEVAIKKEIRWSGENCPICSKELKIQNGKNGEFLACSGFPKCRFTKPLQEIYIENMNCPICDSKIVERSGPKGTYYRCENYPTCKFQANFLPTNDDRRCSKCDGKVGEKIYRGAKVIECFQCKTRKKI